MADDARTALVELLTDDLGGTVDTVDGDQDDGWPTAHVALRTLSWLLDAAGHPEDTELRRRLGRPETVDALAAAHQRLEFAWYTDDDAEWPLPTGAYVDLVAEALGTDLAAVPASPARAVPARFGAPNDEAMVQAIRARTDVSIRYEPDGWWVQRRVGGRPLPEDPTDELDRFIAHWSYRRSHPNPWLEIGRGDAITRMVALQRTSLLWSRLPWRDPGAGAARDRADGFLACFTTGTRYFTNGRNLTSSSFRIDPEAMMDNGVVLLGPRHAGLWWHSEGRADTPLGMSP